MSARTLASVLTERVKGEVRFDPGSRALYATDASNYRQIPLGLVIPRTADDIVQTIATCREFGAPILSRGGGTSLAGQCCNVAVVMDMSKYYNQILELNAAEKWARVQPGVVLDILRHTAEKQGLTFGPDPATHNRCTLGGMIGNNSCGVHALMAGKTVDNVITLDIATYDGQRFTVGETTDDEYARIVAAGGRRAEIYSALRALRDKYADLIRRRYPNIPRRVSGYNLDDLLPEKGFNVARALVGTESTCVTVLEAKVRLVHHPAKRSLVVLGYRDIFEAGDHIPEILEFHPIGLEGIDSTLLGFEKQKHLNPKTIPLLPKGLGYLMVEFGADTIEEADGQARGMIEALKRRGSRAEPRLFDNPAETEAIWKIRESGLGATAFVPGHADAWEGWEDAAVPPERLGDYLRDFRKLLNRYEYETALYGHFGQGCVHCRITFDLVTKPGIDKFRRFLDDAADLVVHYGGSISGEHGDGQSKAVLLEKMFGPELVRAFHEFKAIWDPDNKMNPGKVVNAYSPTENLRLGTSYNPPRLKTHFTFPEDGGDFAHAALRCVGVGECRKTESG
ncbi:MAG: FAD-binding oxidoreductase, partial [Elusimicrobia bacterium]|nr:FAD-binding oxidoreductase [Elusimicrobiota bacterium]